MLEFVNLNEMLYTQFNCRWSESQWRSCDVTVMFQKEISWLWRRFSYGMGCYLDHTRHYSDVVMGAMASQITQPLAQTQIKIHKTLRVTSLCKRNSPVTGELPAQKPVTRKRFPFDDVIMNVTLVCRHCSVRWHPPYIQIKRASG